MLILCTESLKGYGLNRIFEIAKKAGYDGIDLQADFHKFDTVNTKYVKGLVEQYDIPVYAISAPKTISEKHTRELIKMAKELNSKVLILQPPKIFDFKHTNWLKKEIPKLREKEFLSIALENAPAGTLLWLIPEHAMSSTSELKEFKHVSIDTSRIGEKKQDLMRAYTALKKYLVHIHLSNVFHGKKYHPPKEGILPLESFLTKLKQDKYPGAISLKILPKHLHAGDDEKLFEALEESKKYYEKYYKNVKVEAPKEEPEEDLEK